MGSNRVKAAREACAEAIDKARKAYAQAMDTAETQAYEAYGEAIDKARKAYDISCREDAIGLCPDCGSQVISDSGCFRCPNCFWSKCQ